jgi:hypothetical protein
MFGPAARLVVGLEDDPDGSLRVYVAPRYSGIHSHVDDEEAKRTLRREWASVFGHLTADIPAHALCNCTPTPNPKATESD